MCDRLPKIDRTRPVNYWKIGDTTFAISEASSSSPTRFSYRTYWNDDTAGAIAFASYLTDVFRIDVSELRILNDSKSIVDWVISRQNSIEHLRYDGSVRELEAMWPREFRRRTILGVNSDFTSKDVNIILLRGDSKNVCLEIPGAIKFETATHGLNATKRHKTMYTIFTSWDYRKDDGTMVSMFFNGLGVDWKSVFQMVTWPDYAGNTYEL
uniref:FBA_2 domain-containing protein n=1 Tax=Caenorhabditis tropicalis TaxID=1561998 RepID=A0A1I7U4B7_9PELO